MVVLENLTLRISYLLSIALLVLSITVSAKESVVFDDAVVTINGVNLSVEFASTFEQRARGLMYRQALCDDCGMLFKFDRPKIASMWMKNTNVPLSVAYITRDGVIVDIKPLQPHDLTPVYSSQPVTYALEMKQGWFTQNAVNVGDRAAFTY